MSTRIHTTVFWFVSATLLFACSPETTYFDNVEVSVQELRAGQSQGQKFLSLDVLATSEGKAIPCGEGQLEVFVGVSSSPDGPFEEIPGAAFEVHCTDGEGADMAMVVDNSGSEKGFLPWLQEASNLMVDALVPNSGKASLVRVSTESSVLLGLTDDKQLLHEKIDKDLFIRNGWTALFDGIRMGNETLAGIEVDPEPETPADNGDLTEFCVSDRKLGIVAFTDGQENNSSNQSYESPEYPGDGIDTTLEDLYKLEVNNVTTPIYTVGLGEKVDHMGLEKLAYFTGGRHHRVADESDLPGVFQLIADYVESSVKFCTELPPDLCGDLFVKVEYNWSNGADDPYEQSGSQIYEVHVDCPLDPKGNVATILLTMNNPGIDRGVAATLATNTVSWVSAVESPRVLVVRDQNHHNEHPEDSEYVHELLVEAGLEATFMEEPQGGLNMSDVDGFDVVWFSNPGYAVDDKGTLYTLEEFSQNGGGYVLQSDDGTWFFGDKGFSMTPYTGLVHQDNGIKFCNKRIDNNNTDYRYHVMMNSMEETHPVITGLEGVDFLYGDDIDISYPATEGERILAWANGAYENGELLCQSVIPVVVVRSPGASE